MGERLGRQRPRQGRNERDPLQANAPATEDHLFRREYEAEPEHRCVA